MLVIPLLLASTQLSTVAIELADDAPPATVQTVVQSCNQALGAGRCLPAGTVRTTLYAVIRWQGTELLISLRQGSATGVEVERREVEFSSADAPRDRFAAAGLMVAALTAAQAREQESSASKPAANESGSTDTEIGVQTGTGTETETSDRAGAQAENQGQAGTEVGTQAGTNTERSEGTAPATVYLPSATVPVSERHLGFDVGALVGSAPVQSHLKWGGELQVLWLAHAPRLGAAAGVSYQRASNPVQLTWTAGSLGLIARPTPWNASVGFELAAEAVVLSAHAQAHSNGQIDADQLWQMGGRLRSKLLLHSGSWVEPYAGLQLTLAPPGIDVRLEGRSVGSEGTVRFGASLGLRLKPF